ncbi:MAG: S9 family peptidase [Bacteroidetes bacterium]|nr:MAG: S9 family peptidase [Bacteroidota bacterium]
MHRSIRNLNFIAVSSLLALTVAWAVSGSSNALAQDAQAKDAETRNVEQPAALTVDRIFATADFATDRFGPSKWLEDGSGFTTLEQSTSVSGALDIVFNNPADGMTRIMVSAATLIPAETTPEGSAAPLSIADYSWSPDGTKLLIFTNTKRVWRQNTRGDYWILNLATNELQQLGGDAPESTLMFAKVSPDGQNAAYVRQNNVYVENLATGVIRSLTSDGSTTIINGTFDWVHEEEFFLRDGFRWSPDSRKIAFWQLDAEGVGEFLMINNTDSLYSFTIPLQYPKAGTTNSSSRIGIVTINTGATIWVKDDDDPRNHYLARMDWANDSEELIIQHLNRLQNTNEVWVANAETGGVRVIMTDRDDAWLDVVDDLFWLDDGKTFTWVSERDGYRHVYLVDRQTGKLSLVTDFSKDVLSIPKIDLQNERLYFISSFDSATERYLYMSPLRGGEPVRLTPGAFKGWNDYQISSDGAWAIHTHSTFGSPPVINLISLPDHQVVRTLVQNDRVRSAVAELTLGETSFFQVDIGEGVALDGWMIKPSDFDSTKIYPVFFFVYGEPWSQTVTNRWGGAGTLWHYLIAEHGYIVISIDNRGTPGPHGRAWRKMIYGEIGTIAAADQAAALGQISEWPFIDTDRVGIWGWSGGGSMTLNMLFRYPDLYHVGMSVAPVPDQRFYDTIYQERYMGLPQDNTEGYRLGSPITYADGLKGSLLIVHGTGDDNVHYQGTEALVNKLIEGNKRFDMMSYPNRSHGIYEGANTSRHLRNLLTRYLNEHLEAGGKSPEIRTEIVQPEN